MSLILALLQSLMLQACTMEVPVTGTIGPATLDLIERGLDEARQQQCTSILLSINTPGGNLQSTRMIVETILNSEIPFLCLVAPAGAHAGSAGAIILQACHLTGAYKATNIGAATPVLGTGEETPEDLRKKLINDTTSWMDSLTKLRERNQEFGREIITDAKAVSAEQAFELKAIDHLSSTTSDFLEFCKGKTVGLKEDQTTEVVVGELKLTPTDLRFEVLQLISDPQLSYLMFMGSLGLLYFEITHPGTIVPGVLGSIGLVVSLISFHKMNVYWGGLALLLLGIALFVLEIFVPSFGVLGLGGSVSFILGSLFLFDPRSGYTLPISTIIMTAGILIAVMSGLIYLLYQTRNVKLRTAYDDLPGAEGEVMMVNPGGLSGQARVIGEIWKFESADRLDVGDKITVTGHNNLTIKVKKGV